MAEPHQCENATSLPREIPPTPECDFCTARARPVCQYPCEEGMVEAVGPKFETVHICAGKWAACEHCAPFVDRRDAHGLLAYVILENVAREMRGFSPQAATAMHATWTELFKHLGPQEEFVPIPEHVGK